MGCWNCQGCKVYWTADNGTGDVDWTIKARSYGNDEAIDQALPTGVTVTDVLLATDDLHISDATAPITVAGADNSEPVYFEITRPTSDTHTGTVRLFRCFNSIHRKPCMARWNTKL